jgi:hypothetical protein
MLSVPSTVKSPLQARLSEAKAKSEEKANRDNPIFKNRRNSLLTKGITKPNRDKNSTSGSPDFRRHRYPAPETPDTIAPSNQCKTGACLYKCNFKFEGRRE